MPVRLAPSRLERCLGVNFTAGRGRAGEGGRAPKFGILEAGNSVLVDGVRGTRDIEHVAMGIARVDGNAAR